MIEFPPFRLDLGGEQLWRGERPLDLRPKTWQLLRYLAEHSDRLLSKEELLDAVWGDVAVTPASLNQAIRELRKALGDDARNPLFIQTVHRRGFRFIAETRESGHAAVAAGAGTETGALTRHRVFGRDEEMRRLHQLLSMARSGRRQVVFITGEPGIGKTSLLGEFLHSLEGSGVGEGFFVGGGQCVELLGESEAYLPILDALDRLTRDPDSEPLRQVLKRYAPTWMVQLPWLMEAAGNGEPVPLAGSPPRMLREFCVAIEALAAERPTIVWLEDVHWSDPATVDLLSALARRSDPARLLILATYRPVDAAMRDHPVAPLKRALLQSGACHELALELLGPDVVEQCLANRFGAISGADGLSKAIHNHTDGNPLFVETMCDYMESHGSITERDGHWRLTAPLDEIDAILPESLQEMVDRQFDTLSGEEISAIEAASVAGEAFASQTVATALDLEFDRAEAICERLAGWGHILTTLPAVKWPDGSEGPGFAFEHQVFRNIIYGKTPPIKKQRLHLRLAQGLEAANPEVRGAAAAQLALHFERGGELMRAVDYFEAAADQVRRRFANRESVAYLQHALSLLGSLPESGALTHREIELRHRLSQALIHAVGDTSEMQKDHLLRALELGRKLGDATYQLISLAYLSAWGLRSSRLDLVRDFAEESSKLAPDVRDPVLENHFRSAKGVEAVLRGEHETAKTENAALLDALEGVDPRDLAVISPLDFRIITLTFSSWSAWLTGRPDEARKLVVAVCDRVNDRRAIPFGRLVVLPMVATVELFRRDQKAVGELLQAFFTCQQEYGIPWPYAQLATAEGWLLVQSGDTDAGIERMRKGISDVSVFGTWQAASLLHATLAEAELARGRVSEAIDALEGAMDFVENTGERFWEAEIHRLRGECHLEAGDQPSAEECFRRCLEVAGRQGSLSLELRGATSLAALLRDSGRAAEARDALSLVHGRFNEGIDTADLVKAKAVLESF